ncbi:MAG: hypothetical protein RLZZ219_1204 [Cyanobacteriota bacterium]|jgi:hypothetical protein
MQRICWVTMASSVISPIAVADPAGFTLAQLRELARDLDIAGYTGLGREGLLAAIQRARPAVAGAADAPRLPEAAPPATAPAPATPGQEFNTHVLFLPRDPQWAYVFWEISDADRRRVAAAGGRQLCLRLADVTGLPLGSAHPHTLQELTVDAGASEWYVPVPLGGRDYRVELGYRLPAGGWLGLAVSSVAQVPLQDPSDAVDDAFVAFALEGPIAESMVAATAGGVQHELMYQRSTAAGQRRWRVGSEVLHEQGQTLDHPAGAQASGAGLWASGRTDSGHGLVQPRSFWLVADAELIVHGATDPSATLFLGDQQIPLADDGTFRVHVPFRDGDQLYPIRAVAADGEQERSIRLEFDRRTPEARVNRREQAVLEWF